MMFSSLFSGMDGIGLAVAQAVDSVGVGGDFGGSNVDGGDMGDFGTHEFGDFSGDFDGFDFG